MKKNLIQITIIIFNIILSSIFILELNNQQININFAYEKVNNLLNNNFLISIALYYIYVCLIDKMIKKESLSIGLLLKITGINILFLTFLMEYRLITEVMIVINIIIITFYYKQIRLLTIVTPIIFILSLISDYSLERNKENKYSQCQF